MLHWTFLQRERRLVIPAARMLSRTGDGYMPVFTILVCYSLSNPFYRQIAWQLTLLFLLERVIYFVAKNTLRRQRPAETLNAFPALVVASDKFSFPSGHTSAAMLYAAIICQHYSFLGICLLFWAAGVGASRVILGVHYPSDILAGATLGLCIASLELAILA